MASESSAMSPASTNVYRLLRKTAVFRLPVDSTKVVFLDFPVTCNGLEEMHSWKFDWDSLRKTWSHSPSYTSGNATIDRHCFSFWLSGKQMDNFIYEPSFYQVRICRVSYGNAEMAEEKKDLDGWKFNYFDFSHEITFSDYHKKTVLVEITLESYDTGIVLRTLVKVIQDCGISSDVVIKTKDKDFPCHKLALASASEYFVKMFQVDMKEKKESVVDWVGVFEADVVQDLLHYIYNSQAPPNLASTALVLIDLAHMCDMSGLKTMCSNQVMKMLNVENMGDILRVAVKIDSQELQEMSVDFIVQNHDFDEGDSPDPLDKLEPELLKGLATSVMKSLVALKTSIKAERYSQLIITLIHRYPPLHIR